MKRDTKVAGVLFDLNGVLIDTQDWHRVALNDALANLDYPMISNEEHEKTFKGLPTLMKLRTLQLGGWGTHSKYPYIQEAHIQWMQTGKREAFEKIALMNCRWETEKQSLLSILKERGIAIGCVTNSTRDSALLLLQRSGLYDHIDALVTSDDVTYAKPSSEPYIMAMMHLMLAPSQCVIVEDSHRGMLAALELGAKVWEVEGPGDVTLEGLEKYLS